MPLVIAFDPGGTTGVSIIEFPEGKPGRMLEAYQWDDPDTFWIELKRQAERYKTFRDDIVLVGEQFDKRPGIVDPDLTPKYINRDIENNIFDFEIVWQIPAAAKNLVKPRGKRNPGPDQLKRWGWYLTAMPHANDATRHAILYAVDKLRHEATILTGWPRKENS